MKASMTFNSGPQLMVARILLQCGWLLNLLRVDKELLALIQDLFSRLSLDPQVADEKWVELYDLSGRNVISYGRLKQAVALLEQRLRSRRWQKTILLG